VPPLKIETKYFGELDCEENELLVFPKGLFGFEEERRFLLLPFSGEGGLYSLQSAATPRLSFVVMDPFALKPDYAPVLQGEELRELAVERSEDLYYYVLCAVKNPVADSTVNMKCPIAINGETRHAVQVILEDGAYHMRHRLAEFEGGKPSC